MIVWRAESNPHEFFVSPSFCSTVFFVSPFFCTYRFFVSPFFCTYPFFLFHRFFVRMVFSDIGFFCLKGQ
jgi:hypothetical protein